MLYDLADCGVNIVLVWTKAHANHVGNDKADGLAKLGADNPMCDPSQSGHLK